MFFRMKCRNKPSTSEVLLVDLVTSELYTKAAVIPNPKGCEQGISIQSIHYKREVPNNNPPGKTSMRLW